MVFKRRNDLIPKFKSIIVAGFAGLILVMPVSVCAKPNYSYTFPSQIAQNSKQKLNAVDELDEVLKGSVSVDIKPYYDNWTSSQAFNTINHIGTKLVSNSGIDKKIYFVVVEDKDANASTDVNNKIEVNTGLLKYVETEDELAFAIGHEIGHVSKTHVKKSIARKTALALTGVTGTALSVLGVISDSSKMTKAGAILTGGTVLGGVANKKLSRGQETTADKASIDYLVNAGYNPLASISLLNKISGNYFDFFSDHPSGEKRIKRAYKYIQAKYPQYIENGYNTTSYKRAMQFVTK